jgi:hypothetical protein
MGIWDMWLKWNQWLEDEELSTMCGRVSELVVVGLGSQNEQCSLWKESVGTIGA